MNLFANWKPSNYIVAGVGLKAVNVAAGQPGENKEAIQRTINDITIPIFITEAKRRKILMMKEKCKSNWLGNGYDRMVYELLFSALEDLKIFHDTDHVLNGETLYLVNKKLVRKEIINKIHNSEFANELECYSMNEKELYKFLYHFKNKEVITSKLSMKIKNKKSRSIKKRF